MAGEPIDAPLIVAGAPRTGTTHLHSLLALDPELRAPEGWELLYPVPPPTAETFATDPRISLANAELSLPQQVASSMLSIHRYRGAMYKECLSAMSFSFRSEEFISRYHVPRYVDWLQACDMTPAYRMHAQVLQVLQRRMPPRRWVLKSPVHLNNLETLLKVYPDARLIFTHRNPTTVLASVTSLLATLRWAQSDHVDIAAIGRYHADLYCRSLDNLVTLDESGMLPADRVAHIGYTQLTTSPSDAISQAYQQFGWDVSEPHQRALGEHIMANRRNTESPHTYSFDDLGLDALEIDERLSRYRTHFSVAR